MNKDKKNDWKSAFDDLILTVVCIMVVLSLNQKCSGFVNREPATPKTEKVQPAIPDTVRTSLGPVSKTR